MNIKKNITKGCTGIALSLLLAGGAQAAPTFCSVFGSPNDDGLLLSHVTYNGVNANDCYGVVDGNDSATLINDSTTPTSLGSILDTQWGVEAWDFLIKDNIGGATSSYMGLDFTLNGAVSADTGLWTLTAIDTNGNLPLNLPTTLDFLVALKAGNGFGLWLLDDVVFDGNDGGTWTVNILNNGGQIADLSHLTLYVRAGDPDTPRELPEPGILALLGLGLIGVGLTRRRVS